MTLEELAKKVEAKQAEIVALTSEYNAGHVGQDDVVLMVTVYGVGAVGKNSVQIQISEPLPDMVADGPAGDDGYVHYGRKVGITEIRACSTKAKK